MKYLFSNERNTLQRQYVLSQNARTLIRFVRVPRMKKGYIHSRHNATPPRYTLLTIEDLRCLRTGAGFVQKYNFVFVVNNRNPTFKKKILPTSFMIKS